MIAHRSHQRGPCLFHALAWRSDSVCSSIRFPVRKHPIGWDVVVEAAKWELSAGEPEATTTIVRVSALSLAGKLLDITTITQNKYENYPSLCTRTSTRSTSNTSMTVGRGQKKNVAVRDWNRIAGPIGAMPRLPTKRSVSPRRHKLTRWLCNTPIPSPGFFISILDLIIPNNYCAVLCSTWGQMFFKCTVSKPKPDPRSYELNHFSAVQSMVPVGALSHEYSIISDINSDRRLFFRPSLTFLVILTML